MKQNENSVMQKDFILVVLGQIISVFGNVILRFAVPLYLLRETGSSALFGTVGAAALVPMLIFNLVGGILADRMNKRNIMVVLDFVTAAIVLAFYSLLGSVSLVALIAVFLMLLYSISGLYAPSVQYSIPVLLKPEAVVRGNAIINMVNSVSNMIGPMLGGVLFALYGIEAILLVSALCFFASAVMEIFIHIPHYKRPHPQSALQIAGRDLAEGWHFVRHEKRILLKAFMICGMLNLLCCATSIGLPVVMTGYLGLGELELGYVQSAAGLGGILGGVAATVCHDRFSVKNGHILLSIDGITIIIMGLGLLPGAMPEAMPLAEVNISYALLLGMSLVSFMMVTLFNVTFISAVQKHIRIDLMGKVMAFSTVISSCMTPIGQALFGVVFEQFGGAPHLVFMVAGAAFILLALGARKVFCALGNN